jgi:hypothetical protein
MPTSHGQGASSPPTSNKAISNDGDVTQTAVALSTGASGPTTWLLEKMGLAALLQVGGAS